MVIGLATASRLGSPSPASWKTVLSTSGHSTESRPADGCSSYWIEDIGSGGPGATLSRFLAVIAEPSSHPYLLRGEHDTSRRAAENHIPQLYARWPHVQSRPTLPTVPVIMITTEREKSRVTQAIEAGVSDYPVKPFTAEPLREKLEGHGGGLEKPATCFCTKRLRDLAGVALGVLAQTASRLAFFSVDLLDRSRSDRWTGQDIGLLSLALNLYATVM